MKLLAALFAAILLFAMVLGYALNVIPILALFGKSVAAIAMVGLAITLMSDSGDDNDAMPDGAANDLIPIAVPV